VRSIKNYVQAEKARREELGEEGFSLIELIVVVVILGILAAVAIPVFLGLQDNAEQSAVDAVAANAASQTAAAFANDEVPNNGEFFANLAGETTGEGAEATTEYTFAIAPEADVSIDNFCVTVTAENGKTADSGPGC
jgi:type IV pilus assembly protein PilA